MNTDESITHQNHRQSLQFDRSACMLARFTRYVDSQNSFDKIDCFCFDTIWNHNFALNLSETKFCCLDTARIKQDIIGAPQLHSHYCLLASGRLLTRWIDWSRIKSLFRRTLAHRLMKRVKTQLPRPVYCNRRSPPSVQASNPCRSCKSWMWAFLGIILPSIHSN